ncbi:MAG: hypothetical protein Mars2KO_18760 [Maribacter sp.]
MKKIVLLAINIIVLNSITAQEFNQNINKDSLFQVVIQKVHPSKVEEIKKMYMEGDNTTKEFFLMMFSMPQSSKEEQIENLRTNEDNIRTLIREYSELVPDSLVVFIEFNPKDIVLSMNESIDLKIYSTRKKEKSESGISFQEWNLPYDSKVLLDQIKKLGWTKNTLEKIKKLLDDARCRSIKNENIVTIGFSRSGMGKYYYKFFKNDLNDEEQGRHNDGCSYIFFERDIVLEFGGGAVGQQCFEE